MTKDKKCMIRVLKSYRYRSSKFVNSPENAKQIHLAFAWLITNVICPITVWSLSFSGVTS